MEREKEIARLVNVLRKTARMAMHSQWTGSAEDAAGYAVDQYNRVLARLKELAPEIGSVFEPLAPGSSLRVTGMACRQLSAYFEEEAGRVRPWVDDFMRETAREFDEFGEFIRKNVEEWSRRQKAGCRPAEPSQEG